MQASTDNKPLTDSLLESRLLPLPFRQFLIAVSRYGAKKVKYRHESSDETLRQCFGERGIRVKERFVAFERALDLLKDSLNGVVRLTDSADGLRTVVPVSPGRRWVFENIYTPSVNPQLQR